MTSSHVHWVMPERIVKPTVDLFEKNSKAHCRFILSDELGGDPTMCHPISLKPREQTRKEVERILLLLPDSGRASPLTFPQHHDVCLSCSP